MLLLDDVLSELDRRRQDFVLNRIADGQVMITCCEDGISEKLRAGAVFQIKTVKLFDFSEFFATHFKKKWYNNKWRMENQGAAARCCFLRCSGPPFLFHYQISILHYYKIRRDFDVSASGTGLYRASAKRSRSV